MITELDNQDGKPMREYDSMGWSCPHCIMEMIYIGYGDYKEVFDCYCQTVKQPQLPLEGELL